MIEKCPVCFQPEDWHWEGHCPTPLPNEDKLARHADGSVVEGIPGHCFDIDGCSMHRDGTWCPICKFGIKGTFGEPIVKPRSVEETIAMRKAGATWKKK